MDFTLTPVGKKGIASYEGIRGEEDAPGSKFRGTRGSSPVLGKEERSEREQ